MLIPKQDPRSIQQIAMLIARRRPTFGGPGIFYHTYLRREVLVPLRKDVDYDKLAYNLGQAGLSSQIGSSFSRIPEGYRRAPLFNILGSVQDSEQIKVYNLENDDVTMIDPTTLPCVFEITDEDLLLLQEQNQNALMLECEGYIQQNHQNYGEGFDADGRDRNILKGSLWVTPVNNIISFYRPQMRSAAGSGDEIRENTSEAKLKAAARATQASAQSWAMRAHAERVRQEQPMPQRRGTNTVIQVAASSDIIVL